MLVSYSYLIRTLEKSNEKEIKFIRHKIDKQIQKYKSTKSNEEKLLILEQIEFLEEKINKLEEKRKCVEKQIKLLILLHIL